MNWSGLPLPVLGVGLVIWLAIAVWYSPKMIGAARFMFFALSLRFMANFFHTYTAQPFIAGQSLNSLLTLAICVSGLYLFRRDLLRYTAFLPVYVFMAALAISGVWNGEASGMINALIRQALFLGLMVGFVTSIDGELNDGAVNKGLLLIFIVPLIYQMFSIVLHLPKASEADGSMSYIGGYVHEGVFSMVLLTAMGIAAMSASMAWRTRTLLLGVLFVAIVFANYRTSMIAAAPILLSHLVFGGANQVPKSMAGSVRSGAVVVAVLGAILATTLLADRMADIGAVLSDGTSLFKPPNEFTSDDRGLLSGRVFIWNDYIFSVLHAESSHFLVGFGPDSWQRTFDLYAHNVFISYVYEIGVLGSLAFLYVIVHFLVLAVRARKDKRWILVSLHLSYLFLCIGTMPTFTIEGVIFYAMICGYTVYYYLVDRVNTKFVIPVNLLRFSSITMGTKHRA